ncbi:MAG TPA: putative lipid II flippase FtsW [Actinomycetota bacterium]|nr:putative lipid II flippase FtsW [Actinomycetota bacterium]
MTTADAASPRPRHLRLVRPVEQPVASARTRADAASRRTVALLLGSTAFLVLTGLVMVLSASSVSAFAQYGDSFMFVQRQAAYAVVGIAGLILASRMRPEAWRRLAWPLLLVTIAMLALVLLPTAGIEAYGSSRWFQLGPVTVQPSELAKLSLVVFGAAILTSKWDKLGDLGHLAIPLLPVGALVGAMVMLQPDLGTTLIISGSIFLLLFAAGVRLRYLTFAGIAGVVIGAGLIMSADYRRVRFLSFLDPWEDAKSSGYQLIQSLIALGSGGWTGVGLGASRQKWQYVPNAHNDFVFSILGEELGLIGEVVVVLAFVALLFAGLRIATRTTDTFSRLLAAGIVSWFGLQALVNLGAVTGLLPITGVPLPFLSYGGSSLVVSLAAVGVLVSIARAPVRAAARRDPTPNARGRSA